MRPLPPLVAGVLAVLVAPPLSALQQDSTVARVTFASALQVVIEPDSLDRASFANLGDLLQARIPGLSVTRRGDGTTLIRSRGLTSVYADNTPLIVVDGIRIDVTRSRLEEFEGSPSPLDDIDVEQVERIEVLSASRAAALYGTGAANGVIRITTRQARATPTQWRLFTAAGGVNEGMSYPSSFARPGNTVNGGVTSSCTRSADARGFCVPTGPVTSMNPLEDEHVVGSTSVARVGGSISSGSELLAWAAGATFEREGSLIDAVARQRIHARGHARARISTNAQLSLRAHWMDGASPLTAHPFTSLRQQGLIVQPPPELWPGFTRYPEPERELSRRGLSLSTEWRARRWLRGSVLAGLDYSSGRDAYTFTRTDGGFTSTFRSYTRQRRHDFTARADVVAEYRLGASLEGRTSALVDAVENRRLDRQEDWFGTGDGAFAAGSTRINEAREAAGFALSQELAAGDRGMLRFGIRRDDAYVFGARMKTPWYPHASLEWLALREDDGALGGVKLHLGYGKTGTIPSIDHLLFVFLPPWQQPLERKVEVTQAREAGIEGSFLARRVHVAVTGYSNRTTDVLMGFAEQPGFGEILNRGIESSIRVRVIDNARAHWNIRLGYAHNHNELTRAAGIPMWLESRQWVIQGQPVGSYGRHPITSATDRDGDGVLENACFAWQSQTCEVVYDDQPTYHPAFPPTEVSLENSIVFGPLRVSALVDHRRGHYLHNLTEALRCQLGRCAEAYASSLSLEGEIRQAAAFGGMALPAGAYVEDATFTKLRELSVRFDAPVSWSRALRASHMQISIAGRNLATWTDYSGLDPEASSYGDNGIVVGDFAAAPLPRSVVLRVAITQ